MKLSFNNERGAVLVFELAVLAVVIAAAALAGYSYMQHKKAMNPAVSPKPHLATKASPSPSPAPQLTIQELGINIPLSAALSDLDYTYTPATTTLPAYLNFSTTAISAMPGGSFCIPDNQPLGLYTVYTSAQSNVGGTDSQVGVFVASANGYYIYYHHVQYACGDVPATVQAVANLIQPLNTAVRRATAAPDVGDIINVLKTHYMTPGGATPLKGTAFALCKLDGTYAIVGLRTAPGTVGGGEVWLKRSGSSWRIAWEGQNYNQATQPAGLGFPAGFGQSCSSGNAVIYTY